MSKTCGAYVRGRDLSAGDGSMLLRQGQGAAAVRGGQVVLHTAVWARDALQPPLPAEVSQW